MGTVPLAVRAWRRLCREPTLLFTLAYLFVSFIGLWANFWFYRGFGLPILEYMQASDYLVAGLRDPTYALILLVSVALTLAVSGADLYRRTYPQRAAALRERWWGRWVFPESRWLRWKGVGLTPETGVSVAMCCAMLWATLNYVQQKGKYIRAGAGHRVQVTMAGDSAPRAGTARLLGSSGAFVFLWWPQSQTAEAVPIESVAKLQTVARQAPRPNHPQVPAAKARPGNDAGAKAAASR
ncbi:hypothetical protein [Lysobacter terrae]